MKRLASVCGVGRLVLITTIASLLFAPPARASDPSSWQGTTGGTVGPDGNFVLGYEPNSTETYTLSGGTLAATRGTIGYQGVGLFNQSGGSAVFRDVLVLGHETGSTGEGSLSGGTLIAGLASIGKSGRGSFTQTGGLCVIDPDLCQSSINPYYPGLILGELSGGRGTYLLAGGSLLLDSEHPIVHPLAVGGGGEGLFVQTGGTFTCRGNITLGSLSSSSGTYVLEDGALVQGSEPAALFSACWVGREGQGLFIQSGGTASFGRAVALGHYPGATGTYELSDGSVSATRAIVGGRGTGLFVQSGGVLSARSGLEFGYGLHGTGTYEMSGGTLSAAAGTLGVEAEGVGLFVQSGGTVGFEGDLILGNDRLTSGTYRLSDGALSARGGTVGYRGIISDGGIGLMEQSGGSVAFADGLILGFDSGATGMYVLSGGTLSAERGVFGYNGVGDFTQSGGQASFAEELTVRRGTYQMTGGTSRAWNTTITSNLSFPYRTLFDQSGGLAIFQGSWLVLGAGYRGTYALSGGSLLAQTDVLLDGSSRGVLLQSGGTATFEKDLTLGLMVGRKGTYGLSDGLLSGVRGTVGYYGRGAFEQSGGSAAFSESLILGYEPGSTGTYALSGGSLVAARATIGYRGVGEFHQTGGRHTAQEVVVNGRYALSGGQLDANALTVVNEFTLGRWGGLSIERELNLGHSGAHSPIFHAEPFSTIHMTGPGASVRNFATDPSGLADLVQLWMVFQGSGSGVPLGMFEVAGKDLGPTLAGYQDNFALGVLELGGTGLNRRFTLTDEFDSQPGWVGPEALYVDILMIHQGIMINPAGLSLYYRNHEANVKRYFVGDVDLNGVVDGGDLALMSSHWWRPDGLGSREEGDLNGDGWIDGGDLALLGGDWWEQTQGPTGSAPLDQALPEPVVMLLLAAGGATLTARRRMRR